MKQTFVVYDIKENNLPSKFNKMQTFNAYPTVKDCLGCFSCWIKTPGECIINDRCLMLPKIISTCSDFIIISPMAYGGFSRNVKAVMDRSIGYMLPYFRKIQNETHHQMRYHNALRLHVYFYGTIDEEEKAIAQRYVRAVATNFGASEHTIQFYHCVEEIYEVIS